MNALKTLALIFACATFFAVAGCDKGEDHDHDHDHGEHGHDEGSKGGDHGHEHTGERHELGTKEVDGHKVTAVQINKIEKGEGTIEVKLGDSKKGTIVVRTWIGVEDGSGSVKAKAEYNADPAHDDYDAHAEAPAKLPEGAAWWVELEGGDKKSRLSFPIK